MSSRRQRTCALLTIGLDVQPREDFADRTLRRLRRLHGDALADARQLLVGHPVEDAAAAHEAFEGHARGGAIAVDRCDSGDVRATGALQQGDGTVRIGGANHGDQPAFASDVEAGETE